MTEYKKGDRLKITAELTVAEVDMGYLRPEGWHCFIGGDTPGVVSIEKLPDPLPTTPGSVIRSKATGLALLLHNDGTWHGRCSGSRGLYPDDLVPDFYDVLHDAGAESA